MTDRELMQQALGVINCECGFGGSNDYDPLEIAAALRERLSQPEPGTWREVTYDQLMEEVRNRGYEIRNAKIIAPQPKQKPVTWWHEPAAQMNYRKWQGLTDDEREQFRQWVHPDIIEAIELRLQERNT